MNWSNKWFDLYEWSLTSEVWQWEGKKIWVMACDSVFWCVLHTQLYACRVWKEVKEVDTAACCFIGWVGAEKWNTLTQPLSCSFHSDRLLIAVPEVFGRMNKKREYDRKQRIGSRLRKTCSRFCKTGYMSKILVQCFFFTVIVVIFL